MSAESTKDGEDPFFLKDNILYRRWSPQSSEGRREVEQLVLPVQSRRVVMELAHSIPMAGHLGKRLLQKFYWPTLYKDVEHYCKSCKECQKASPKRRPVAALVPLPIIDVPFERIAMDIGGPLPRSRKVNKYILLVCDYATRWPKAVPLKAIDAEHMAEELLGFFPGWGYLRKS